MGSLQRQVAFLYIIFSETSSAMKGCGSENLLHSVINGTFQPGLKIKLCTPVPGKSGTYPKGRRCLHTIRGVGLGFRRCPSWYEIGFPYFFQVPLAQTNRQIFSPKRSTKHLSSHFCICHILIKFFVYATF